ncbi:HPP family protein [Chloroflexota bacterium]
MDTNSERFLTAFGAIERRLRLMTGLEQRTRFYKLVDCASAANPAVRRYSNDLKEYADLRNAIVHERTDEHVIAEPNDRAVRQIENILALLDNPPRVIPNFQKPVYTMTPEDPIAAAAFLMLAHDFSQLPIVNSDGHFVALLTSNDITRWIGISVPQQVIDLEKTVIAEIMNCNAEEGVPGAGPDYTFFSRDETVFAALDVFQECGQCGVRLEAILITQHGSPAEELLGIITIWDLPTIYDSLG